MTAPRSRGVRLAALAALALAGGTAATLLSASGTSSRASRIPGAVPERESRPTEGAVPVLAGEADPTETPIAAPLRGTAVLVLSARNGDTGNPATGALVRVTQPGPDREARLDGEGFARLEGLLPGHSLLRLSSPGRRSAARRLRLLDDEEVRVEMTLLSELVIAGRVVAADGGAPIGGARVRVVVDPVADEGPWRGLAPDSVEVTTGDDGKFSAAAGLPNGESQVIVRATGFRDEVLWVRLPPDAATPLDIEVRLLRSGVVRGFVRTPEGAAVAGVEVVCWGGSAALDSRRRTPQGWILTPRDRVDFRTDSAADGSYAIEGLPRGALYAVAARRNNLIFLGGPRPVFVPESGEATLDLVLGQPGTIRFDWGGFGPPEQGLRLRLRPIGDDDAPPVSAYFGNPRGAEGLSNAIAAPPGRWTISLTSYKGEEMAPQDVVTVVSGRETVVPVLGAGESVAGGPSEVRGVVVDAGGAGIPGANVHVRIAEDEPSWKKVHMTAHWLGLTDSHGSFHGALGSPVAGRGTRVRVLAHAPGFKPGWTEPVDLPCDGVRLALEAQGGVRGGILVPPGPVAPVHIALFLRREGEPGPFRVRPEQSFLRFGSLADGSFLHEGLDPGPGVLEIRTEAGSSGPIPVVVPAGAVLDLGTIELPPSRSIRCRVVDPEGFPIAHAVVRVPGEGPLIPEGRTGTDGTCIVNGVAPDQSHLRAAAAGWYASTAAVPAAGVVEFVLRRGGRIVGTALDGRGRPAAGCWVFARSRDRDDTAATRADPRGRFEIPVGPGVHDLELRIPDLLIWGAPGGEFTIGRAEVVVEDGRAASIEIRATR